MKGKLSRMCRSGLSMMLALIMMFSMATVAFATEGGVSDIAGKYEVSADTVAQVQNALDAVSEALDKMEALKDKAANVEELAAVKAKLSGVQGILETVIAKAENTDLVQDAIAIKNEAVALVAEIEALMAEAEEVMAELDEVNAKLAESQAKLEALTAKAEALGADPADVELLQNTTLEDLATMTPEQIDELKAALDRVMALEDESGELQAEAEALKADMEALEDEAEALQARADEMNADIDALTADLSALKGDVADLAKSVVVLVKETVSDLAGIATVLKNMAAAHYEGAEEYIYKSLVEQGYIALANEKIVAIKAKLSDAKARVEANTTLSPEFKAELLTAIDNAAASAEELKAAIASANNVKEALPALAASAVVLETNLKDVVDLFQAGTRADLAVAKKAAVEAYELGKDVAQTLADIVKAAIYNATHATIALPCDAKIVAMGDGSVAGYAAQVAAALKAALTDISVQGEEAGDGIDKVAANAAAIQAADIVTIGYGFDGITNFVADQMTFSDSINWGAIMDEADVKHVDEAMAAVRNELAKKLDPSVLELVMIAVESYAFGYAKYLVEYPMLVNDIHNVNPNALVVVVGVYNPLKDVVVAVDGVEVALGDYLNKVIDATGLYNLASAILLPNTIYVEADAVANSLNTAEPYSPAALAMKLARGAKEMLPTAAGYSYITNQIVNALNVSYKDHVWGEGVKVAETGLLKFAWLYTCTLCGATKTISDDLDHRAFMKGYPEGDFRPENSITRAEVAQMFFNMLDEESKGTYVYTEKFSDVVEDSADNWYCEAVLRLAEMGAITGYPDGTFRPNDYITRAEFTAIAVRLSGVTVGGTEAFPDVEEGAWYYDYVTTSVKYNWVNGYPEGDFRPEKNITRAEAAKVACGMLGRPADEEFFGVYLPTGERPVDENGTMGELKVLSDIEGHWAFYWILEATNNHYHKLFG